MNASLFLPVLGIAALGVVAWIVGTLAQKATLRLPYAKKAVLTDPERELLRTLIELYGSRYLVFPQVHLASFMEVERDTVNWRPHFNRIIQKSVDFVLCDKTSTGPVLAIELDDRTHEQHRRIVRDAFVDEAARAAGVPLVHIRTAELGNAATIRERIEHALAPSSIPGR